MRIEVNGKTYNDSRWQFDNARGMAVLTLLTSEPISVIASTFDGDDTVVAYDDNDNRTGVWYVHSVFGIYENYESRTPEEPREVIVDMKASALTAEAEVALNGNIEENTEAILELADLIADMKSVDIRINNLEGVVNGIPVDIVERFAGIGNLYNELADRVARLENRMEGSCDG